MPRRPLLLAVGPADPHRAACAYASAFALAPPVQAPAGWQLRVGSATLLVTGAAATPSRWYTPGRTPRLELRVDDVDAWVEDLVAAGFTERVRLPEGGPAAYAHVRDPHGHLWALAGQPVR